jgi:hypothetical protein
MLLSGGSFPPAADRAPCFSLVVGVGGQGRCLVLLRAATPPQRFHLPLPAQVTLASAPSVTDVAGPDFSPLPFSARRPVRGSVRPYYEIAPLRK